MFTAKDRSDLLINIVGPWRSVDKLYLFMGANVSYWDVDKKNVPIALTMQLVDYKIILDNGKLELQLMQEHAIDRYEIIAIGEDTMEWEKDGKHIRLIKQEDIGV
jgi:hypothetical protein